jgi:hypothetical protein
LVTNRAKYQTTNASKAVNTNFDHRMLWVMTKVRKKPTGY